MQFNFFFFLVLSLCFHYVTAALKFLFGWLVLVLFFSLFKQHTLF